MLQNSQDTLAAPVYTKRFQLPMKTLDRFLFGVFYPLTLFAACLVRLANLFSIFYFIGFLTAALWPVSYLNARRSWTSFHVAFVLTLSVCGVLGQLIYQGIAYSVGIGASNEDLIYQLVGFIRLSSRGWEGIRFLVADVGMIIITSILTARLRIGARDMKNSTQSLEEIQQERLQAIHIHCCRHSTRVTFRLFSCLGLLLTLSSGVSFPSIFGIPYMFAFVICLIGLRWNSIIAMVRLVWKWLLFYNVIYISLVYIFQLRYIHDSVGDYWTRVLGLISYSHVSARDWPVFVGYTSSFILFLMLTKIFEYERWGTQLRENYKETYLILLEGSEKSQKLSTMGYRLVSFLLRHGWKFCLVGLLYIAFLQPSVLSMIVLLILCVGQLVRNRLTPYLAIPTFFYLFLYVIVQYIYNIEFSIQSSSLQSDFGLKKSSYDWAIIGSQCVVIAVVGVYWIIQKFRKDIEANEELARRERQSKRATWRKSRRMSSSSYKNFFENFAVKLARYNAIVTLKDTLLRFINFILENSYLVSLAGLYFCGLTEVNILNAGYMLFFILFIISPRVAKTLWIGLVIYAELVLILLYFWQWNMLSSWHESAPTFIGLRKYDTLWIGVLWNILIMIFSGIQFHLNNYSKTRNSLNDAIVQEKKIYSSSLKLDTQDEEHPKLVLEGKPTKLKQFIQLSKALLEDYGIIICYVVFLVVGVFDALSLFSIFYLLFLSLCLLVHMFSESAKTFIKGFWSLIVLGSSLILISRYVYQFEGIYDLLHNIWDSDKFTWEDIGYYVYKTDQLFLELLPNVVVLVLSVMQWRGLLTKPVYPDIQWNEKLVTLVNFFKRLFYLHASKITVFVIWFVVASEPTAFNFVYLIILLVSIFFQRGPDTFGLLLLFYSECIILAQMLFNLPAVDAYRQNSTASWFGLKTAYTDFYWGIIQENVIIVIFLMFERIAHRWRPGKESVDLFVIFTDSSTGLEESRSRRDSDSVEVSPALKNDIATQKTWVRMKWYMNNFYTLYGYEVALFVFTIALCTRDTILGIFWPLILLGVMLLKRHKAFPFALKMLIIFFILTTVFQYVVALGFPPATSIDFPWRNASISEQYQKYLLLLVPNVYVVTVDFIVLYLFVLLTARNAQYKAQCEEIATRNDEIRYAEFKTNPKEGTNVLRFWMYRNSVEAILVIMFIAGTARADVLSLGYVAFSLYFLWNSDYLLQKRNSVWKYARIYNYILILLQMFYQAPFIVDSQGPSDWQSILGLEKLEFNAQSIISNGIIFDLIIMALLRFQKRMFHQNEFNVVRHIVDSDIKNAYQHAKEYLKKKHLTHQQSIEKAEMEKLMRWLRLCEVKSKRTSRYGFEQGPQAKPEIPQSLLPLWEKYQASLQDKDIKKEAENNNNNNNEFSVPFSPGVVLKRPALDDEEHRGEKDSDAEIAEIIKEQQELAVQKKETFSQKISRYSLKIKLKLTKLIDYLIEKMESAQKFKRGNKKETARWKRFLSDVLILIEQQSKYVCMFLFVINHAVYASVLSLFYPILGFGYALLLEDPRPSKRFWNVVLVYTNIVIVIKYLFQISLFCLCSGPNLISYDIYPNCGREDCNFSEGHLEISYPYLLGVTKVSGIFLGGIFWDLAVLLSVYWHRAVLKHLGLWDHTLTDDKGKDIATLIDRQDTLSPSTSVDELQIQQTQSTSKSQLNITELTTKMQEHANLIDLEEQNTETASPHSNSEEEEHSVSDLLIKKEVPKMDSFHSIDIKHEKDAEVIQVEEEQEDFYSSSDDEDEEPDLPATPGEPAGPSTKEKLKSMLNRIKEPFRQILEGSKSETGSDYFTPIFLVELVSFCFLVIFQQDFTGVASTQVSEIFSSSYIPISYLSILICQFGLIILERIIYLYHSYEAKLILQYIALVFYHVVLFFYLPVTNEKGFAQSPSLIVFYLIKCCYFLFSALQINGGYPVSSERFLTRKVNDVTEIVFIVYRAIPFVFELKTLLDFICTDTSLIFKAFLKLEDLYAELFLVKCQIAYVKDIERKPGEKMPKKIKCFQGVIIFVALVILIWFPLLILSSGNPSNQPNLYSSASISLGISGSQAFFQRDQNIIGSIDEDTFNDIRQTYSGLLSSDIRDTQVLQTSPSSDTLWQLTPPGLQSLKDYVEGGSTVYMQTTINFFRPNAPAGEQNAIFTYTSKMNQTEQQRLGEVLDLKNNRTSVIISNFMPRYMRLTLAGAVNPLTWDFISANFTLNRDFVNVTDELGKVNSVYMQWWEVKQVAPTNDIWTGDNLEIVTISQETVPNIVRSLAVAGVIGLYVGVVLSVGRFLRMWVSSLIQRIYLDDMPNVDDLLRMCEDIFIARYYKDLLLEEQLYRELIELFRSPDRLVDKTKSKDV